MSTHSLSRKLLLSVTLLVFTSCAYYTVSSNYIGNDTYETFAESSTPNGANAKALQKAAEIASKKGFSYLIVLGGSGGQATASAPIFLPTSSTSTSNLQTPYGPVTGTTVTQGTAVTSFGVTYYTATLRVQLLRAAKLGTIRVAEILDAHRL